MMLNWSNFWNPPRISKPGLPNFLKKPTNIRLLRTKAIIYACKRWNFWSKTSPLFLRGKTMRKLKKNYLRKKIMKKKGRKHSNSVSKLSRRLNLKKGTESSKIQTKSKPKSLKITKFYIQKASLTQVVFLSSNQSTTISSKSWRNANFKSRFDSEITQLTLL